MNEATPIAKIISLTTGPYCRLETSFIVGDQADPVKSLTYLRKEKKVVGFR